MKTLSLLLMLSLMAGCAGPRKSIEKADSSRFVMRYQWGPHIKVVDPLSEMEGICRPGKFQLLGTRSKQLPGTYRFEREVEFHCAGDN